MACRRRIASHVAVVAARLRPSPALPDQVQVQVFGLRDSRPTQRALRFFSDRSVPIYFVDIARKAMAVAELRRFTQRFGAAALIDRESPRCREAGLAYLSMDDDEAFDRLLADQQLLRLPLARQGAQLSVGVDEDAWGTWLVAQD